MRVTLKTINAELAKRGHNTHLEKAGEYFYFYFVEAVRRREIVPGDR